MWHKLQNSRKVWWTKKVRNLNFQISSQKKNTSVTGVKTESAVGFFFFLTSWLVRVDPGSVLWSTCLYGMFSKTQWKQYRLNKGSTIWKVGTKPKIHKLRKLHCKQNGLYRERRGVSRPAVTPLNKPAPRKRSVSRRHNIVFKICWYRNSSDHQLEPIYSTPPHTKAQTSSSISRLTTCRAAINQL